MSRNISRSILQVLGWLDPQTGVDAALALLSEGEPGPGELAWRRVSTRVGNSRYLAQINI